MPTGFSTTEILPGFELSTDPARLDVELIHEFLRATYWARGRSREVVERSIRHSLPFGVYARDEGRQVAFARVITDRAVFGYLADVFVIPPFRGRGIAKALVAAIMEHPDLRSLTVFLLRTRDAHGLYRQAGFEPVPAAEELMGRYR